MFKLFLKMALWFLSFKKRTLLIVLQNNNELRSGGGFITQVLEITMGKFSFKKRKLDVFENFKTAEAEKASGKMKKLLKIQAIQFRDCNTELKFNENAKKMIKLYRQNFSDKNVAMVVAVNFSFIEDLLGVLGKVMGYTKKNLFYKLSVDVSNIDLHSEIARNVRKTVITRLFNKLFFRAGMFFWKWIPMNDLIRTAVENRDLQFYFADGVRPIKSLLNDVKFENGDYVAIVDNNYLGVKTNRYLQRRVNRKVMVLTDERGNIKQANVNLEIELFNANKFNYPLNGVYQSVINIYVPQDEENFEIENKLLPGESKLITINYVLDKNFFENEYVFKYIKQPGVKSEFFSDTIIFPLNNALSADNKKVVIRENTALLDPTQIEKDLRYKILLEENCNEPRIYFHELIDKQTIEIRFNEPVKFTKKVGQMALKSKSGDKYEITEIEKIQNGRIYKLKVPGLPSEKKSFYSLDLEGVINNAGVAYNGSGKKVTVVYKSDMLK